MSERNHGTPYRYDQGCHCDECRAAKMRKRREVRARGRASNSPAYQRELAAGRERKERYRGTCEHCGAATSGCNGRSAAPTVCADCAPSVYGPIYAARQRGHGPVVERILSFIGDGERSYTEIHQNVGITKDHAGVALSRLLRFGLVVRIRRGVYRAATLKEVNE